MGVTTDDPRAPYQQVADTLRAEIRAGLLTPGKRMPSIQQLTKRFSVSGMTVQAALRELRTAGLITTQQGRGTFVRTDALELIHAGGTEASDSADVVALSRHLEAMEAHIRELSDRLTAVESAVQSVSTLVRSTDQKP